MIPNPNLMFSTNINARNNRSGKVLIFLTLLTVGVFAYLISFEDSEVEKSKLNPEIIEQLQKTTTGDFLIFENGRVGLVQLSGGIEEGSFSFTDLSHTRSNNRFGIGDWKSGITEVILKSDTLKWYEKAKEHLIP